MNKIAIAEASSNDLNEHTYVFTRWKNKYDNEPEEVSLSWPTLRDYLGNFRETACEPCPGKECSKKDGAAYSPALVKNKRSDENVVHMEALALDFDAATKAQVDAALVRLRPYRCIVHSTHSHQPVDGRWSLRAVIALTSTFPITKRALEWRDFYKRAAAYFGASIADPKCVNPSRIYFGPSVVQGRERYFEHWDGRTLEVEDIPQPKLKPVTQASSTSRVLNQPLRPVTSTLDGLRKNIERLRRSYNDSSQSGAEEKCVLLGLLLSGEALAEPRERDNTINRVMSVLAFGLSSATQVEDVIEVARNSIQAMDCEPEGADYWLDKARDCYERAVDRRQLDENEESAERLAKFLNVSVVRLDELKDLTSSQEELAVRLLNERYAYLGSPSCVIWESTVDGKSSLSFFKEGRGFRQYLAHHKIPQPNGRVLSVADIWMSHPKRRTYERLIFEPAAPGKTVPEKNAYNIWKGWAVAHRPGKWDLFQDHIYENICQNNHPLFDYLLRWMAEIVQNPSGRRPGVLVAFRGRKGTGKGAFWEHYSYLFGIHAKQTASGDDLTGKFNSHLADCLLFNLDEGFWAGDRAAESKLKSLTTESKIPIEKKGQDKIFVENRIRILITTNNDWVVPASEDERRYCVIDVGDKHRGDRPYFAAIDKEMRNGGYEAMLWDLMHMEVGDLGCIPQTAALIDQKERSLPLVESFWISCLREGKIGSVDNDWPKMITNEALYQTFESFCKSLPARAGTADALGKAFKKIPGLESLVNKKLPGSHRPRGYYLPDLSLLRVAWERERYPVEWPVD